MKKLIRTALVAATVILFLSVIKSNPKSEYEYSIPPIQAVQIMPELTVDTLQESCLQNAVYFEARGVSIKGQIAVADVIMNRVDSGSFGNSPCEVVYQGVVLKHLHNFCQFSFACMPKIVSEPVDHSAEHTANEVALMVMTNPWVPDYAGSHLYYVASKHSELGHRFYG